MKQESSIKTSLRMILLYVLVLILGTVVCAAIYTVYSLCMNMIAGGGLKIFNLGYFLAGVNKFFPMVVVVSGIIMGLYLIRYSIRKVLPVNVLAISCIAAWVFLVPLNYGLLAKYNQSHPQKATEKSLTTDYFRTGKSGAVFYYSAIENGVADGVCIDSQNFGDSVYTFSDVSIPSSRGYSDSLIHKSIGMPWVVELVASWVRMFLKISHQAWESGFLSWICFASISLALASVVGLTSVSRWRMINVVLVCAANLGILVLNIMAYTKSFMDPAKIFMEGAMSKLPIKNPLVVLMNVLLFIIFSLIGFIMHNKWRKEERDGE